MTTTTSFRSSEYSTDNQTTATIETVTVGKWNKEYNVKLYQNGWQVANLAYGTMSEAEEVAGNWASEH